MDTQRRFWGSCLMRIVDGYCPFMLFAYTFDAIPADHGRTLIVSASGN